MPGKTLYSCPRTGGKVGCFLAALAVNAALTALLLCRVRVEGLQQY